MPTERLVTSTRALAAALAVSMTCTTLPTALAQLAGSDQGLNGGTETPSAPARTMTGPIGEAHRLADEGQLIRSRGVLDDLVRSNQIEALSDAQRAECLALLKELDSRIRASDGVEISLQRAEHFLTTGDLRQAERHANAVGSRKGLDKDSEQRLASVLDGISERRAELQPMIPGLIEQAEQDFTAQRYPAAKSAITAVLRSGVQLSDEQLRKLETFQIQIIDIENTRGEDFRASSDAGFSMMQPGTVRRGNESGAQPSSPAPSDNDSPAIEVDGNRQPSASQPPPSQPAPNQPASTTQPSSTGGEDTGIIQAAMRAEAQRTLAEADQAYNAARYREAIEKYGIVTSSLRQYLSGEEVARAERQLAEARARMDNTGRGLAEQVAESQQLVRQRVQAEFTNRMNEAQRALEAGEVVAATDAAAQARIVATSGRDAFSQGEMDNFMRQVDELGIRIEERRRQLTAEETARQESERIRRAREAEERRVLERNRKINESIDRIRALQAERKYEEALKVVDDVLFLDPNNPTALLLRDILRDIVVYKIYNDIQKEKAFGHAMQTLDNEQSTIPTRDVISFPDNWPGKTVLRGEQSAFTDTVENRRMLAQLSSTKLPADFNGNRFADVVEFVRTVTQLPVDVDWDSLSQVGVDQDTQVTLRLSPMPMNILLDRIMSKVSQDPFQRAAWTVDQGILTIASDQALRQNRTLVIYNIRDLLFEIPDYDNAPAIDLGSVLNQSEGGGGQSPFEDDGDDDEEERLTLEERIQQIVDIIQANVDPNGWVDTGGETGTLQELNSSLIITNTPQNHREIVGLLSKLREIRNMQINVETKFLLVNQNWFEQIGFDLDIVLNADNNQIDLARSQDRTSRPSDFFDFSGSAPTRGLQRQGTGSIAPNAATTTPANTQLTQGFIPPTGWSPVGVGQNSLGLAAGLTAGDFASGILQSAPALGIAGQFLDDVQVDFLIAATQADQRTVNLTAPRLTFTNGQTANIYVVTQQAFVSDLEPVVGDSAVGFDPEVSAVSEGVTLLVEGVISADRRYVTLNVDAGVARIDGFAREAVTAVAGGQLVNSADTQSFIQLPTVTVTRVRTSVTVPDEGTILLGGQRLITEFEVETGVPVLSKIPILNRFFTNRIEGKEEQTLLILLKPTVLIQSEQEERSFPGLADSVRSGTSFVR